jgi:hypothetical protein
MGVYRKKPVVVEAVKFTGSSTSKSEIRFWMEGGELREGGIQTCDMSNLEIETLEGVMKASPGDYIIKGVNGEFYPCKPDIFEKTYEKVEK